MNGQEIEKEIVDKGLTAPRVTKDHIESLVTKEQYMLLCANLISQQITLNALALVSAK